MGDSTGIPESGEGLQEGQESACALVIQLCRDGAFLFFEANRGQGFQVSLRVE